MFSRDDFRVIPILKGSYDGGEKFLETEEEVMLFVRPSNLPVNVFRVLVAQILKDTDQDSTLCCCKGELKIIKDCGHLEEPYYSNVIDLKSIESIFSSVRDAKYTFKGMYVPSGFSSCGGFIVSDVCYSFGTLVGYSEKGRVLN
jgi:hypothetical protein